MISRINMCEKNQNSQSKTNNFLNKLFEKKQTKTHKFKYTTKPVETSRIFLKKSSVSHPVLTCSNLTIETLHQGVKYVQS